MPQDDIALLASLQFDPNYLRSARASLERAVSGLPLSVNMAPVVAEMNKRLKGVTLGNIYDPSSQKQIKEISASLNNVQKAAGVAQGGLSGVTKQMQKAGQEALTFGQRVGFSTNRLAAYLIPATAIFQLTRGFRAAKDSIIDINKDTNRLTQILNGNAQRASQVAGEVLDISRRYGQSGKELLNITTLLAQSGKQFSGNALLATTEALAKTPLAATFGEIEDTTRGLIAALNQFNLTGDQSNQVLDVANELAKKFAIQSADIFTSVQTGGKAFQIGGGTIQEFSAFVAAAKQLTGINSRTIGTGFNTIFLRLLRPQSVQFLENLTGGKIRDAQGNLKRVTDILLETGKAFSKLNKEQKAFVAETLFGIRQGKIGIPLLEDISKGDGSSVVLDALDKSKKSAGSLARDSVLGLQRIETSLGRIGATFDQVFGKFSEDRSIQLFFKDLVSVAESFAKVLGTIQPFIGSLLRIGTASIAAIALKSLPGFLGGIGISSPGSFRNASNRQSNRPDVLATDKNTDALERLTNAVLGKPNTGSITGTSLAQRNFLGKATGREQLKSFLVNKRDRLNNPLGARLVDTKTVPLINNNIRDLDKKIKQQSLIITSSAATSASIVSKIKRTGANLRISRSFDSQDLLTKVSNRISLVESESRKAKVVASPRRIARIIGSELRDSIKSTGLPRNIDTDILQKSLTKTQRKKLAVFTQSQPLSDPNNFAASLLTKKQQEKVIQKQIGRSTQGISTIPLGYQEELKINAAVAKKFNRAQIKIIQDTEALDQQIQQQKDGIVRLTNENKAHTTQMKNAGSELKNLQQQRKELVKQNNQIVQARVQEIRSIAKSENRRKERSTLSTRQRIDRAVERRPNSVFAQKTRGISGSLAKERTIIGRSFLNKPVSTLSPRLSKSLGTVRRLANKIPSSAAFLVPLLADAIIQNISYIQNKAITDASGRLKSGFAQTGKDNISSSRTRGILSGAATGATGFLAGPIIGTFTTIAGAILGGMNGAKSATEDFARTLLISASTTDDFGETIKAFDTARKTLGNDFINFLDSDPAGQAFKQYAQNFGQNIANDVFQNSGQEDFTANFDKKFREKVESEFKKLGRSTTDQEFIKFFNDFRHTAGSSSQDLKNAIDGQNKYNEALKKFSSNIVISVSKVLEQSDRLLQSTEFRRTRGNVLDQTFQSLLGGNDKIQSISGDFFKSVVKTVIQSAEDSISQSDITNIGQQASKNIAEVLSLQNSLEDLTRIQIKNSGTDLYENTAKVVEGEINDIINGIEVINKTLAQSNFDPTDGAAKNINRLAFNSALKIKRSQLEQQLIQKNNERTNILNAGAGQSNQDFTDAVKIKYADILDFKSQELKDALGNKVKKLKGNVLKTINSGFGNLFDGDQKDLLVNLVILKKALGGVAEQAAILSQSNLEDNTQAVALTLKNLVESIGIPQGLKEIDPDLFAKFNELTQKFQDASKNANSALSRQDLSKTLSGVLGELDPTSISLKLLERVLSDVSASTEKMNRALSVSAELRKRESDILSKGNTLFNSSIDRKKSLGLTSRNILDLTKGALQKINPTTNPLKTVGDLVAQSTSELQKRQQTFATAKQKELNLGLQPDQRKTLSEFSDKIKEIQTEANTITNNLKAPAKDFDVNAAKDRLATLKDSLNKEIAERKKFISGFGDPGDVLKTLRDRIFAENALINAQQKLQQNQSTFGLVVEQTKRQFSALITVIEESKRAFQSIGSLDRSGRNETRRGLGAFERTGLAQQLGGIRSIEQLQQQFKSGNITPQNISDIQKTILNISDRTFAQISQSLRNIGRQDIADLITQLRGAGFAKGDGIIPDSLRDLVPSLESLFGDIGNARILDGQLLVVQGFLVDRTGELNTSIRLLIDKLDGKPAPNSNTPTQQSSADIAKDVLNIIAAEHPDVYKNRSETHVAPLSADGRNLLGADTAMEAINVAEAVNKLSAIIEKQTGKHVTVDGNLNFSGLTNAELNAAPIQQAIIQMIDNVAAALDGSNPAEQSLKQKFLNAKKAFQSGNGGNNAG